MTIPIALTTVAEHIKAWREDEIAALRRHDDHHAQACRKVIAALERLETDLRGKVAA